jgi:uncharacterized protein YoxC
MSFSEMLEVLGVSSSFLNYHLENLGELVSKTDDSRYKLSSFGEAAMATMTKVEDIPPTVFRQSPQTNPKRVVRRSVAIALGIICILLIASMGEVLAYYGVIINDKEKGLGSANKTISQLNANVTNLQDQDKQLQTSLDGNETLLNQTEANNRSLQSQIDTLNSSVTNLQNQVNNFHIGSTENSKTWVSNEIVHLNENVTGHLIRISLGNGSVSQQTTENVSVTMPSWQTWFMDVPSAGYVSIRVSSNNNSTYVGLVTSYRLNITTPNIFNSSYIFVPQPLGQFNVDVGGTVVFPVSPTPYLEIYVGSYGEATVTVTITYYC